MRKLPVLPAVMLMTVFFLAGCGASAVRTHRPASSLSGVSARAAGMSFNSIHMVSDRVGWATGSKGAVLRTVDGGAAWRDVTPSGMGQNGPATLVLVGLDRGRAWVAKAGNGKISLYGTDDGGEKWTALGAPTPPKNLFPAQIYAGFVDAHTGWLLVTSGPAAGLMATALFMTRDGGKTWPAIGANTLPQSGMYESGLTFANDEDGWITGTYHADFTPLYMTTDGGRTWHRAALPLPSGAAYIDTYAPRFFGRRGLLPAVYHVAGRGSEVMIYRTDNEGRTWETGTGIPLGNAGYPQGPAWRFINAGQGFVTDGAVIYRTEDAGRHWTGVQPNVSLKGATMLDFRTADEGWAIAGGRLLKTTDGGRTWNPQGAKR